MRKGVENMTVRKYESVAARQKAYRARKQVVADARVKAGFSPFPSPAPTHSLQYRAWRTTIAAANEAIERVYEEINEWMQERSERWHESDRGYALQADYERLEEVLSQIADLDVLVSPALFRPAGSIAGDNLERDHSPAAIAEAFAPVRHPDYSEEGR